MNPDAVEKEPVIEYRLMDISMTKTTPPMVRRAPEHKRTVCILKLVEAKLGVLFWKKDRIDNLRSTAKCKK